jgi:Holliday junction resolvasome RuvABC endonuclease subunit
MELNIVGVDPSLSNFGFAIGRLDITTDTLIVDSLKLVETKPEAKTKNVRQSSLDYDRAVGLYAALTETVKDADMIFVEMPVGSQSSRAQTSYGVCIGLIASITDIPVIQVSPSEVKKATVGSNTATKEEMIAWAFERHPDANWKLNKQLKPLKKMEHVADAVAAIEAGIKSQQYLSAKSFLKMINKTQ